MAIGLDVTSNIARVKRDLPRVLRRQIPFAASLAINHTLRVARNIVHRQWHRQLGISGARLRTGFPRNVLRVERSTKRRLYGRLYNFAGDEVIDRQLRGGSKRLLGNKQMRIPLPGAPRRTRRNTYVADDIVFAVRARGASQAIAVLKDEIRQQSHFDIRPAIRHLERVFSRQLDRALRRAIRTAR